MSSQQRRVEVEQVPPEECKWAHFLWACHMIWTFIGLGMVIVGGFLLWLGVPKLVHLHSLDLEADFPPMQNNLSGCPPPPPMPAPPRPSSAAASPPPSPAPPLWLWPGSPPLSPPPPPPSLPPPPVDEPSTGTDECSSGRCIVVGLWTRPVVRQETCGRFCGSRSICYDDWVAEFAWVGGPSNGKPVVKAGQLRSRIDEHCDGGCDSYGGWRLDATVNRSGFTSVAVSQAWKLKRCTDCTCDDDGTVARPTGRTLSGSSGDGEGDDGIALGRAVVCRVPKGPIEDVSDVYDCPSPSAYNSVCARLGDVAQIELDERARDVEPLVVMGSVSVPVGLIFFVLNVLFLRR